MATSPAKQEASEGTVIPARVSQQFHSWLNAKAEEEDQNRSNEVAMSQLDRMLVAESLDDILDADELGARQARDIVGLEFEWKGGFRVVKSSDKFEATLGVYIQFEVTALSAMLDKGIAVGDIVLISTGAPLIIGKLRTLEANGFVPIKLMITGTDAGKGTVLKLRRPPNRAETA